MNPSQTPKGGGDRRKAQARVAASKPVPYENEYTSQVNLAADPVIAYMNPAELERSITRMRADMVAAAKNMEFMEAARLRDEIIKMEDRLKEIQKQ